MIDYELFDRSTCVARLHDVDFIVKLAARSNVNWFRNQLVPPGFLVSDLFWRQRTCYHLERINTRWMRWSCTCF